MNICSFRDDNSEYQDHVDISKCIPSIKISSLSLMDPPEEQVTLDSGNSTQRGHWVGPFSSLFLKNLFRPNCKITPFNIFCVVLFRGMMLPPSVSKLSNVGQTESSTSPVSKGCSGPSSNFVR